MRQSLSKHMNDFEFPERILIENVMIVRIISSVSFISVTKLQDTRNVRMTGWNTENIHVHYSWFSFKNQILVCYMTLHEELDLDLAWPGISIVELTLLPCIRPKYPISKYTLKAMKRNWFIVPILLGLNVFSVSFFSSSSEKSLQKISTVSADKRRGLGSKGWLDWLTAVNHERRKEKGKEKSKYMVRQNYYENK